MRITFIVLPILSCINSLYSTATIKILHTNVKLLTGLFSLLGLMENMTYD